MQNFNKNTNVLSKLTKFIILSKNINLKRIDNRKGLLLLPILNYLNINIPDDSTELFNFSLGLFILSLISLLCFLNVIFYLSGIILIQKYDIEEKYKKYPRFIKFIKYYTASTLFYVIVEFIICFCCLLMINIFCLAKLGVLVIKL